MNLKVGRAAGVCLSVIALVSLVSLVSFADSSVQSPPFSQNWSNTGLITADDNWSGVPGILGYRGDGLAGSTGVSPATILADGTGTPIDVNANRTDPNTFATGGVAEFQLANPVIALNGSGTAAAPFLLISLNTTGLSEVTVSYTLRDLDGSSDNAVQSIALHYRIGNSGSFTNVPAAFVADATSGPGLATLVTPVSVTLPSTADDKPLVQLRIMTTNAVGNDEWVGVDDISVAAASGLPPTGVGAAIPPAVYSGDLSLLTVAVTPGQNPISTGLGVVTDLQSIGGSATQPFFDDGTHGDVTAGDGIFSFTAAATGTTGARTLTFTVSDAEGRSSIGSFTLNVVPPPIPIHAVQGGGSRSPFEGQTITTTGIVTALRFSSFYIQTPDAEHDGDPLTSEGLLVFTAPGSLARGDLVRVTGRVVEFVPAADPSSPSITEVASGATIAIVSRGNPLPAPAVLLAGDTLASGDFEQLERYEGMRVKADVTAVSGTDGNVNETAAAGTSNGDFFAVIRGVSRPMREAGIDVTLALPPDAPATVPRFDANPERLRVDSNAQIGSPAIEIVAGQTIAGLTGVLDYGFRCYTIVPDPQPIVVTGNGTATPVPEPAAGEFTVASFNMERFYDNVNDPALSSSNEPVLSAAAFERRLAKASLAIRDVLRMPDVLGVEEVENVSALRLLADRINADAVAAGMPNPMYEAYLEEGNDIGGIDSGFLVKAARIQALDVIQVGKDVLFDDGTELNDRPPLVLLAQVHGPVGTPYPVTLIVNHLRSLNGIDEEPGGDRVRRKRQAQAEFLANYIQQRQSANADERIVSIGDYNAFDVNDGYVDVLGTILGTPTPAEQVTRASADLVSPDLFNVATTLDRAERYSFVFDGTAQTLDHILINQKMRERPVRMAHARSNADFPESLRSIDTRPERLSDHDVPVAYFALPGTPTVLLNGSATMTVECGSPFTDPGATASDPHLGPIAYAVTGAVTTTTCGSYTLTYTADNGFVSASAVRTVNVVDSTAPSLILNGADAITLEAGSTWVEPGASALDGCAGNLTAAIAVTGTVNTSVPGAYTISYAVSDGYNTTTKTRIVTVVDTTAPSLTPVTVTPSSVDVPNHKMFDVALSYGVTDVTGAVVCSVAVEADEPVNAAGDGNTNVDWQVLGPQAVRLRAERSGTGDGRVYTIRVTCSDASGNAATDFATVTVASPLGAR